MKCSEMLERTHEGRTDNDMHSFVVVVNKVFVRRDTDVTRKEGECTLEVDTW